MDATKRFPKEVTEILEKAGWFPGRTVDDHTIEESRRTLMNSDHLEMPASAESVLREFGGWVMGSTGPGVNVARTSLDIAPLHAEGGRQEIRRLADVADVDVLYPLGIFGDNDGLLLIDSSGRVYLDYEMNSPISNSFDEALVKLLTGIK